MSAPARGRGGATATRGTTSSIRGRGSHRLSTNSTNRSRGRGKSGGTVAATPNNTGLLQKLRNGAVQQTSNDGANTRGRGRETAQRGQTSSTTSRGRGALTKTFGTPRSPRSTPPPRSSSPALPVSHRDFMTQMNEKFQSLKFKRDTERKQAIQDGFLADPEKKTSLANAITPVGTCTDMCPQFEKVERIVQNMVDKAERVTNEASGRDMPSEDRMVKRFRRSAAGYDEQLPSDIRTPQTLRKTLDYLLDKIVGGGERLAAIHKFVWDRTRGIRNDFSIQQVTRKEDVKIAVECYERIARFHILSLHQLSNSNNLLEGEHFDAHQEREQLNNTLLSLMYYYDDNRGSIPLPNEPEFRSYCILFELQALTPDLEDRMQTWPVDLLNHPKVQTAFSLYAAAGNTVMDQGPLRPSVPFSVAQSNAGKFWTILASHAVSYIMACVAEMNFSIVRFTALDALWRSGKSAPQGQQARNQDWSLSELQNYLAFDDEDETLEFCQAFDLAFKNNDNGEQCLDLTAMSASALDKSSMPSQQIFSHGIVEEKRYRRTLVAVINGISVATAIRQGLVIESSIPEDEEQQADAFGHDQSIFIPEQPVETRPSQSSTFGSALNPFAPTFTPSSSLGHMSSQKSPQSSVFGQDSRQTSDTAKQMSPFGTGNVFPGFSMQSAGSQNFDVQEEFLNGGTSQQTNAFPTWASGVATTSVSSLPGSTQTSPPLSGPSNSTVSSPPPFNSLFGQAAQLQQTAAGSLSGNAGITPVPQRSLSLGTSAAPAEMQQEPEAQRTKVSPLDAFLNQNPQSQVYSDIANNAMFSVTNIGGSEHPFNIEESASASTTTKSSRESPMASTQSVTTTQETDTQLKPQPLFAFVPPVQQPLALAEPLATSQLAKSDHTVSPTIFDRTDKPSPSQTPLSSFAKPDAATKAEQSGPSNKARYSSLPAFESSATSQRPQPDGSKYSATSSLKIESDKTTNSRPTTIQSVSAQPIVTGPQSSRILQQLPPPEPSVPKSTEADRVKLVENTARIILTQPQGLIEYFISHHVSNLLQTLVKEHLQQQQDRVITYVRTRHLSRKFFSIWREKTQRSILGKRAKQRRKLLAAAMQAEQAKKMRNEAELEAILVAARETKRIQDEQRKKKNETFTSKREETMQDHRLKADSQIAAVAGQKRKTRTANDSPQGVTNPPHRFNASHKRSRTIGTVSEPSVSTRRFDASNGMRSSGSSLGGSNFGQSFLGRSTSSTDLRRSLTQKVDATKTDYFKLKAMGIDPTTPFIPDTAESWEMKKNEQARAKEALITRSRSRPSIFSASITSRAASPSTQLPVKNTLAAAPDSPVRLPALPVHSSLTMTLPKEDALIQQLREAREALAQDEDWLKDQRTLMEKEIESHEILHKDQSSRSRIRPQTPRLTANGLAQANGHDYQPAESSSVRALSRTEQRIRKTGAHGLATRPIGGNYIPVAMSRQSALKYADSQNVEANSSFAGKNRLRGDLHDVLGIRPAPSSKHTVGPSPSPAFKRVKESAYASRKNSRSVGDRASANSFAALQNYGKQDVSEEEEEEELVEDDDGDDDEPDQQSVTFYHRNGTDGDTEDNDDDLLEDEDEEEDEDEAHDIAHHYAVLDDIPDEERAYDDDEDDEDDDSGTPGTFAHFSRAQSGSSTGFASGPGASVEEAVVLSD